MRGHRNTEGGFSLSEVTISIGIVATLMLPLLAMLADSGGKVVDTQDRIAASHLVRSIESQLRFSPKEKAFLLESRGSSPGGIGERILLGAPGGGDEVRVFFGFDRDANFVREIESSSFDNGFGTEEEDVFYLAEIGISGSGLGHSASVGSGSLYRCEISVEAPAYASAENRKRQRIATLLSGQ